MTAGQTEIDAPNRDANAAADMNQDGAVDAFDIEPFIEVRFPQRQVPRCLPPASPREGNEGQQAGWRK